MPDMNYYDFAVDKVSGFIMKAHEGQTRWNGDLYTDHLHAVARNALTMFPSQIKRDGLCMLDIHLAALLHDVVEDTSVTVESMYNFLTEVYAETEKSFTGYRRDSYSALYVRDAVVAVTKIEGEPYLDYLKRVCSNSIARIVKMADLAHNMSDLDLTQKSQKNRFEKYTLAMYLIQTHEDQ